MTPTEAVRLLELPPDATPEQLEARFLELRAKLEDKIAKAPTPGLKAKYRESLDGITVAFETLTLAADCSALPVLQRGSGVAGSATVAGVAAPGASSSTQPGSATPAKTQTPPPHSARKSGGGREFWVVALIAIAVLVVGGWFVMKTRAENAEKARLEAQARLDAEQRAAQAKLEAEQKAAEQVRQAENARRDAEAKRVAEEQERTRAAAAAKAEQEQQERKAAEIHASLAEVRIAWEATEQAARSAERKAGDLRSESRSVNASQPAARRLKAELAAQQRFTDWLVESLARHPARVSRIQAEQLLAARSYDRALAMLEESRVAQHSLDVEIAARRTSMLTLTTSMQVSVTPAAAQWQITDAYGETHQGSGTAVVDGLPFGEARLHATLDGYEPRSATTTLKRDERANLALTFVPPKLTLHTIPAGASVQVNGQPGGITPVTIELEKPGKHRIDLALAGYRSHAVDYTVKEGQAISDGYQLMNEDSGWAGFNFNRMGDNSVQIARLVPGAPGARAGLLNGMVVTAVEKDGAFVSPTTLSNFDLTTLLAGSPDTHLRLQAAYLQHPAQEARVQRVRVGDWESNMRKLSNQPATVFLLRPPDPSVSSKLTILANGSQYDLLPGQVSIIFLPHGNWSFRVMQGKERQVQFDFRPGSNTYIDFSLSPTRPDPIILREREGVLATARSQLVQAKE